MMSTSVGTGRGSRRFSKQFKAEAVQMVVATGKTIAEVAKSLGVSPQGLGKWVAVYRAEHPESGAPSPVEAARIRELEDQLREARLENEFLKKAAAFFARTVQ